MRKLEIIPLTAGPGHYGIAVPVGSVFLDLVRLDVPDDVPEVVTPESAPLGGVTLPALLAAVTEETERVTVPVHVVIVGNPISDDAVDLVGTVSLGTIVVAVFLGAKPYSGPQKD